MAASRLLRIRAHFYRDIYVPLCLTRSKDVADVIRCTAVEVGFVGLVRTWPGNVSHHLVNDFVIRLTSDRNMEAEARLELEVLHG